MVFPRSQEAAPRKTNTYTNKHTNKEILSYRVNIRDVFRDHINVGIITPGIKKNNNKYGNIWKSSLKEKMDSMLRTDG